MLASAIAASILATVVPADHRPWVVTPPDPLRERIGTPTFEGTLVEVRGFDSDHSRAVAILRLADGSLRSVTAAWLDPESRALVDAWPDPRPERRARRAAEPALPTRDDVYAREGADAAGVERRETEHFVFHWGERRRGSGSAWFEPEFRERTIDYFEEVRDFYRDVLKAPLPGRYERSDLGAGTKTNVYVTGTGLRHHEEGFAFAALDIIIHPSALAPGSSVVPHEFAHCVQLASTGFRNSEYVGWFWENHAEWCTHQYFPGHAPAFHAWLERRHYELNSSRMNYGSWMWLQLMAEDPALGPEFVFRLWTENRKNAEGASIEDPIQTTLRLLEAMPEIGSPEAASDRLGALIGALARRTAFWSELVHGLTYAESEAEYETYALGALRHRGVLRPIEGLEGAYLVPYSQAPRDFGVHIVDLLPIEGATRIGARLEGIHDVERPALAQAASTWRWSLLVERADGSVDGVDGRSGERVELPLREGDRRVRLAVAATPRVWEPIDFRPGYNAKRRFPYAIALEGATPRLEPERSRASAEAAREELLPHPNGGGLRSPSATVAESAFIGPEALVLGAARVEANARILDRAVVRDRAVVSGNAVVRGVATVRDAARVGEDAMVADGALVAGSVEVGGRVRVLESIHLHGNGTVGGDVLAKGWGEIHTNRRHPLGGWLFFGEDCEVHCPEDLEAVPMDDGRVYGFMASDQWREPRAATGSLSAAWLPARPFGDPRDGARPALPIAFVPDRTADHPLTLLGGALVDDEGRLDARRGSAIAEGTPIAAFGWTIRMSVDDLAPAAAGGELVAIRFEDGTGVERRLVLAIQPARVALLLDGALLGEASEVDLVGPSSLPGQVSLYCDGNGRLTLRVGERTMLEATLPEPWRLALPRGLAFSAARFTAIETHRSAESAATR